MEAVMLTNDSYLITMHVGSGVERNYRDGEGWAKVTTRGRTMPATSEQVLNHLLPALAGAERNVQVDVEHRDLSNAAGDLLTLLRRHSRVSSDER